MNPLISRGLSASAALAACAAASAQEAINTDAATQPSTGTFVVREQVRYLSFHNDPSDLDREIKEVVSSTTLTYGLRNNIALSFNLPLVYRETDAPGPDDHGFGIDDLALLAKWRILKHDSGPLDTLRVSLLGGVEIPSGDAGFSSHSFDPILGAVLTTIRGRHGFNQAVQYKFNTGNDAGFDASRPETFRSAGTGGDGPDDALRYDSAYLFRLAPAAFTADTTAAVYAVLELNGLYETGGDNELLLSPGLLYEGRTWALELTVQFPIWQDVDERLEMEFGVGVGIRVQF